MKKWVLCFLFILSYASLCYAQENIYKRINAIHIDFQKHADTTFIIQKTENGYPKPNYFILSKKDKQLNIYFYGDATRNIRVPGEIKSAMTRANFNGDKLKSFENVLFYPVALTSDEATSFWQKIMLSKPWQINDDPKNQYCADSSIKLFDGPDITLFLITKNEIKSLMFPSPDFFEEKCPGNEHRKAILKIQNTFKSYFKF